ncbi:MAG TPA: hypothetical protein VFW75_15620, partial [Acetobacteraceae bacterium]|nr:hypothetical protein [Acetobacteraceae bacterium]
MLPVLPLLGGAGPLAGLRLAQADPPPPSPPFPDGAELLIAGPDGGLLDRWCRVLAPALGRSLPAGTAVRLVREGGADGVTGANQFEVRALHDGSCALLTPGEAAIAWLVGDPRAQFDVGGWVPVLAGTAPSLLVG